MPRGLRAVLLRNCAVGVLALALVIVVPGAIAQGATAGSGQLSPAAQMMRARGYLVPDPAAYAVVKAKAAAAAGQAQGNAIPNAASVTKGWQGVTDPNFSPSDSTGAVGPTRYIETINDEYGIYDRTVAGTPTTLQTGTLATLTGDSGSAGGFSNLSDPQIVWDPGSSRFYYLALDVVSNHLEVGWSKDGSPSGSADFCKYDMDFGYGTSLPDYPKLGTTADFLVIGANAFNSGGSYIGSDIDWMAKPGAGTSCPTQATVDLFKKGRVPNVRNQGGGCCAFTPVPAIQTDPSSTGWVIARTLTDPDTRLTLFSVTNDGSGNAVIPTNGTTVTVSSYAVPPNAPQKSTSEVLDTLDGRPMQAVSGFDPVRGKTAVWTNQTIAGGAGSKARWYEIDPAGAAVLQTGDVTDGSLYVFNAATSPDRVVNGATTAFGSSMATVFSTSASTAFPAIQAVTKVGAGAQSSFVSLKTSSVSDTDFSCDIATGTPCRWGDYSAATPDPAADTSGAQGTVWFTNAYSVGGSPGWSTWNGALQLGAGPAPTVTSTSPSSSVRGVSNILITVNGTNFLSGAVASFSGTYVVVNSTGFVSSTQLTANVTIHGVAAFGPRDVTVTNPGGSSGTCVACFTVTSTSGSSPTVTSTSPSSSPRGVNNILITVNGTNFLNGATVSFSGTYVQVNSTSFVSSTQLTANVTIHGVAALGPRDVTVTNPGGSSGTCAGCFTVTSTSGSSPTVTLTSPSSSVRGVSNILITVNGTNFLSGAVASFSGTYVVVNSTGFVSSTQLTANVTIHGVAALGPRNVTVTNPGGSSGTCVGCFTVTSTSGSPPTVTSTSPSSLARGSVGITVIVTGTGFLSGATVSFSGTYVQVNSTTFVSSTQLSLSVTVHGVAAVGARNVTVTNPGGGGSGTCTGCFTVT